MANPGKDLPTKAGVLRGYAPPGYSEVTVVDATSTPILRVFARDDVLDQHNLMELAFTVHDSEVQQPTRLTLKVLR